MTQKYLDLVKTLVYEPVNHNLWKIIQLEGLDEEFGKQRKDFTYAELPISNEDKTGLMQLEDNYLEKFNIFDIKLKDLFNMEYIDFIDYDKGKIFIIRIFDKMQRENNFKRAERMLKEGKDYWHSMAPILYEEAATVARDSGYQFTIYFEPLGNPSFHVRYKDDWEVVLSMKTFKIIENKFGPYKKGRGLPSKIMNKIYEVMKQENTLGDLVWHYARHTWNLINPKYPIDVKKEIPML